MNALWSALLNGGILGTALAAAVWVVLALTPRRFCGASTRYLIWWIALAVVLAAPAFQVRIDSTPKSLPAVKGSASRPTAAVNDVALPRLRALSAARTWRILEGPWQRRLLLLWLASSSLLLLRLARGYAIQRRIRAAADNTAIDAGPWLAAFGMASGSVRTASSPAIRTPVAVGVRHPEILIPSGLIAAFDRDELDHVGLHETAHLLRRDPLALLVERILEAIFWLHPAVRFIARRIDLEREIACDDLVVAATRNPRGYASCLTRMVELCGGVLSSPAAAGFAEYRPHLSQRVELIMKQTRRSPHSRAVVIAAAAVLCGLTALLAQRPAIVAFAQAAPRRPAPPAAFPPTRLIAFYFDTVSMTADDLARATTTALKLVDTRLKDEQSAAIIVANGKTQVRQDFTADREILRQAIRGDAALPVSGSSDPGARLTELRRAIAMLGPLEGRKALIYFAAGPPATTSDGDRPALQAAIDDAQRGNVAVYVINPRGGVVDR
jgi:beta-lactamase regulating signal transducer with metallopeptidase domain